MTEPEPVAAEGPVGPLPEAVRARVVALAADVLGRTPSDQLPTSLRRVASFAPSRRARLAGAQIASVVENDDSFRELVAERVRLDQADLAQALEAGTPPAAADPGDLAAVVYLLRPTGWTDLLAEAVQEVLAERAASSAQQATGQLDRLRRQLDTATDELRELRERSREQTSALKAENAELRHKLGDERARVRTAEAAARNAERTATQAAERAAAAGLAAEADLRRLRARVEELERDVTVTRRSARAEKGSEALRARLLLDTLLETAQGLRRELALPAVDGAPADAVEAFVAEHGARTPSSHGSMLPDDPSMLDELLRLPRVHLIVDGYNVTKTAWPDSSLERQRDRLLAGLAPLAARSGAEVTVVFDAAETTERPLVNRPRGVRVLYSPMGVIADDVIRDLVAAEPRGRPLVVVSSDQAVVRDVLGAGARAVASPALSRLLARS